ncbi:MAG: maleylpyruvate isomerase family mycothiol-dependent enzyme [Actinomycetota bacterium]
MEWEQETAAEFVRREGHRLVDICAASPTAPVAACPGWTTTDLAVHTATVYRRVAGICTARSTEPPSTPVGSPPEDAPFEWCHAGVELVADSLGAIGVDEPVWTWTDRHDGGFYQRRMIHETVVHLWDAETAAGAASPIDPAVAADGVDEVMSVGMRFRSSGAAIDYPGGSIALLATDTGHRWSLAAVDGVLGIGRGEAAITATDATLTGPAEALLLAMWGRPAPQAEARGDAEIAAAWCAVAP